MWNALRTVDERFKSIRYHSKFDYTIYWCFMTFSTVVMTQISVFERYNISLF